MDVDVWISACTVQEAHRRQNFSSAGRSLLYRCILDGDVGLSGMSGLPVLRAGPHVALHVRFAVSGRAESLITVRTFKGFGAGVQTHVDLQTAFSGKRRAAHVAREQLLTCTHSRINGTVHSYECLL